MKKQYPSHGRGGLTSRPATDSPRSARDGLTPNSPRSARDGLAPISPRVARDGLAPNSPRGGRTPFGRGRGIGIGRGRGSPVGEDPFADFEPMPGPSFHNSTMNDIQGLVPGPPSPRGLQTILFGPGRGRGAGRGKSKEKAGQQDSFARFADAFSYRSPPPPEPLSPGSNRNPLNRFPRTTAPPPKSPSKPSSDKKDNEEGMFPRFAEPAKVLIPKREPPAPAMTTGPFPSIGPPPPVEEDEDDANNNNFVSSFLNTKARQKENEEARRQNMSKFVQEIPELESKQREIKLERFKRVIQLNDPSRPQLPKSFDEMIKHKLENSEILKNPLFEQSRVKNILKGSWDKPLTDQPKKELVTDEDFFHSVKGLESASTVPGDKDCHHLIIHASCFCATPRMYGVCSKCYKIVCGYTCLQQAVDNCTKARIGMASADLLEKAFKKEGIITPRPPPEIYTTGDPPPKRDNVIPYEEPKL